jgi:glucosamine-6-phosphate deaminase
MPDSQVPCVEHTQLEKIAVSVHENADQACLRVATEMAELIRARAAAKQQVVFGLATGSTPVRLYQQLIRMHREEGLSFANVVTFNLDEYYDLGPDHPESYRRFMQEQLFNHIDIPEGNTHVPDGLVAREKVFASCSDYEKAICDAGGIDLQILGIGRTGHIGFNEPGSGIASRTRLVTLDSLTRRDAARDFLGEENVPRYAITMGVGSILEARKIVLLAWGDAKADVIQKAVELDPVPSLPASFLQAHDNCTFHVDKGAASNLTRLCLPWLVGPINWDDAITRRAVLWLARKTGKPLLKLVEEDYAENGMADLLTERGSAYNLNIALFNTTQHTITGWPGGKPNADDSNRPERSKPFPKRVLVLSPEPLEDVFCMGGTLHRLANQGNQLQIAYLTSGNLAVPDGEVQRALELFSEMERSSQDFATGKFSQTVAEELKSKGRFGADTPAIRRLKGWIRRSETRSAARILGINEASLHFMDLPFYEQGRYRRFEASAADNANLVALLQQTKPHQIFTTGYHGDPLSVASIGFQLLKQALKECLHQGADWFNDCNCWLFRGAGEEWEMDAIDMAVPLSPDEFANKIQGIYQHQSQRSQSPVARDDADRNTWTLARRINQSTANAYDALGLAEYEAIEAFKRWIPKL